jgi:hypothetical protein
LKADNGSIVRRSQHGIWEPVALILIIFICAAVLIFADPGKIWSIVVAVVSTVAGAQLGNVLRADLSGDLVRNQARPATRELFDHSSRLSGVVQLAESRQLELEEAAAGNESLDPRRVADWFGSIGFSLRGEIASTASAIENWGDLARDVLVAERASYVARQQEGNASEGGQET